MEELWNLCGSFMEKILDWNMEKLWSICGDLTHWKIASWKIPKRDTMEWYTNKLNGWKNVSENCRLDAHTRGQGGFDWNYFRRGWNIRGKALLLFGMPSDWIPC